MRKELLKSYFLPSRIRDRDGPNGRDGPRKKNQKGVMRMKRWMWAIVVMMAVVAAAGPVFAAGTPAGTTISNKATAHYTVGTSSLTADSNQSDIKVAEIINLTATWQDASPGVNVSPGQTNRVTSFRVTNTGNGNEQFNLSATGAGIAGDQFDPTVTAIYMDTNNNLVYDSAGGDTLYSTGTSTLAPDGFVTVFVLSTIPTTTISDGDKGNVQLTATSKTGTGAPGFSIAGVGDGGTPAVFGASGGTATATGNYVVSSVVVTLNKTVTVIDQFGGIQPVPGATLRYAIAVTVAGSGTAVGMKITDPIPTNTTYKAGTLKLNGAPLTDGADLDAGDVGGTTAGIVAVTLSNNLTSSSPVQTITFDVTIN